MFISRIVVFSANTSTQTMGPRPAAAATAATPAVRTVPQYKYAAGVRNPQQHLNTQPQVAMQQVCNFRNWSCFCCSFFSDERRGCLWLRVSFVIVELRLCIMAPVFSLGALSVFQVHLGWDPVLLHIFQLLDTLAWVFCLLPSGVVDAHLQHHSALTNTTWLNWLESHFFQVSDSVGLLMLSCVTDIWSCV